LLPLVPEPARQARNTVGPAFPSLGLSFFCALFFLSTSVLPFSRNDAYRFLGTFPL
jgi:hypothetical protein